MTATNKQLQWLNNHSLEIIAGFLLAFLPLYPKWPLFDVLPGYIVRVRLEDFLILAANLIILFKIFKKQLPIPKNPLFKLIILYWVVGLLSSLSAIFITHTVPFELAHVGKLFLHWARRIEYMSLVFIFYFATNSKAQLKRVFTIFAVTTLLVSLYGFGQKYLQWPVYSTMNREFAKGWRLVLTEHARVNSTFAGHYDLAGFTVIALPVLASLFIFTKSKLTKSFYALTFVLTFAILLLTASRTSFIAYFGSIFIFTALLIKKIGFKKSIATGLVLVMVSITGYKFFGSLKQRFEHFFSLERVERLFPNWFADESSSGSQQTSVTLNNDLRLVYDSTDTPPSTPNTLPPDVYEDIPESFPEASLSGIPDTSGTGTEGKPRTYSENAEKYGLSSAIRFDALWPRALEGFKSNPLLGSGYSTLTKVQVSDFTEAESTDNDFLRALGETGLLGVLSFLAIFFYILWAAFRKYLTTTDPVLNTLYIGFITSTIALMVNALYIDIFTASKVAYMFWTFVGITLATVVNISSQKKHAKKSSKTKSF